MNMKKGFTLIEIMIVVAIIAILAAIAIPNFLKYRETAQTNSCKSNLGTIETAAEAMEIATNGLSGAVSITISATAADAYGLCDPVNGTGFLKKAPKCPKGGTYTVARDATTGAWKASCSAEGHTALTSD